MKKFFQKPFRWAAFFSVLLVLSTAFVLLDTFVIPQVGTPVTGISSSADTQEDGEEQRSTASNTTAQNTAVVTDTSYEDENIKITIETVRNDDTTFYVADIQVSSVEYLKAAFANGTFGRNIKETTSSIAQDSNAIFAINGDYYGFRNYGYVIRNGVLYRDTASESESSQDLVIDSSGNFSIINEQDTSAAQLMDAGAWQVFSFGPALVNDGQITVTASSEVDKSMTSNPRTAIGQISALHYLVIVSDGRTSESAGLSLLELAQEFYDRGCTVAYNLDGGGSSTMWFNGEIINNPTDGRKNGERSVSDIVYFG